MLNKINITRVICDHFKTLRNQSTDKLRLYDYFLFLFFPLVAAFALLYCCGPLPQQLVGVIVTSLSVFTGLLLNLLLLAFNVAQNLNQTHGEHKKRNRRRLLHEVFINVSFAVLVAITSAFLVLIFGVLDENVSSTLIMTLTIIIYFLGGLFLLTLFMLLRRIYSLLRIEQIG